MKPLVALTLSPRAPGKVLAWLAAAALALPVGAEVTVGREVVTEPLQSEHATYQVVEVLSGLEHPWAIAWLPDGRMLVTERPGRLQLVDGDAVTQISNLPGIHTDEDQLTAPQGGDQGGLLDVAVHPDYAQNGWIYLTFSSPGDDDPVLGEEKLATGTALARARLSEDGSELVDTEVLYVQAPRSEPGRHYGSRIVFPGDGTVLFSIGDRGIRLPSQDLTHPAGSIIRLNEDGTVPEDNPLVGVPPGNLRPEIYSFGHRNNQGMIVHPETNEIWATEHGPRGGDLVHRIEAGANYGWPQVAFGTEYSTDQPVGLAAPPPGVTPPVHVWEEAIAPSGLAYFDGEAFPAWQGNLFAGSLLEEQLHRLVVADGKVVHEEILLDGVVGRIRDVRQGPDGLLYVATDEAEGGVYRLEPSG
jgi:aldose sugar dehydrogenase